MALLKKVYKKLIPLKFRELVYDLKSKIYLTSAVFLYRYSPKRVLRSLSGPRSVLFYPTPPSAGRYGIKMICHLLGYKITNNPAEKFPFVMVWQDSTFIENDETLSDFEKKYKCINAQCRDISKERVQIVFEEVFGYALAVDPLTFTGPCVKKSNLNSQHDGKVVQCPLGTPDENAVYERRINNQCDDNFVEDIRVTIFKENIPLIFFKYRSVDDRFDNYCKSAIATLDPSKMFSEEEIQNIIAFCKRMGLEYGELDVLRDRDDHGRIYIVDVNNTPWSPPKFLNYRDKWTALKTMADAFEEAFVTGQIKE